MKILEKMTLVLYSLIILVTAVILSLLIFGWLSPEIVGRMIMRVIEGRTSSSIFASA